LKFSSVKGKPSHQEPFIYSAVPSAVFCLKNSNSKCAAR